MLPCALSTSACRRVSERTLTDTEGRQVIARCDREGRCELERKSGSSAAPDKPQVVLHTTGRLVTVCDSANSSPPTDPAWCRALVCKEATNCPPAHGLPHGACVNELCIEPANAVGQADAVVLCLAGTGLGRASVAQVGRHAMALNCGNPCTVPAPCRRP